MIIGNGSIARAFKNNISSDYDDYVIFASGVSNSNENMESEFNREFKLLSESLNYKKKIIYFTSVLSLSKSNNYYNHKYKMEQFIIENFKDYIIYRIPQIINKVGFGNKFNLVNAIVDNILNNKEMIVYKEVIRAILGVDDLVEIVDYTKDKINRDYVNISYIEKIYVSDLVEFISEILNKPAIYKIENGLGNFKNWDLQNTMIVDEWIIDNRKIKGYTKDILRKYL